LSKLPAVKVGVELCNPLLALPVNDFGLSEDEFQSELHYPLASRANERIAGPEVRRRERSPDLGTSTKAIPRIDTVRSALRVGGDGMIEDVEDLPARLDAIALLERKVLEDGDVPAFEPLVAEDIAAHVAEGS
jgi:hypothetical protein